MHEAAQPELLVSALGYDQGRSCAVVSLAGRADIGDCAWIRPLLERQAEQGYERVVVDLSRLSSIDWWVAIILIWAGRVISRRGGVLMLAAPQPAVAQLLKAVGASRTVVMCVSVRQARRRPGVSAASA